MIAMDSFGPLVDSEMSAYYEGDYMDHSTARARLRDFARAAIAAEREACREVVEECIRRQAHLASNAREALSEVSARIDKRGRA